MATGPSSYYPRAPGQSGSSYSVSTSYGNPGPSMVDSRGIPIFSMGYSNPSGGYSESGYSESTPGDSDPAGGNSESSRSYTNSQPGMLRTFR